MGKLIDKYKNLDKDFNFEFNSYVQQIKSDKEQE